MAQPAEQNSAAYANSAARGMNPVLVIGLIIAVAVLVGLVVGLSVVIFKGDATPPQQIAATPAIAPTAPVPTAPAPAPSATPITQTLATEPAPSALEAPTTPSVVEELRKAREATEAEVAAQAKAAADQALAAAQAAEAAAARAAAQPSQDIINWLGSAKLSGVKLSDAESKVILNGEAYSVGEYVNFKLGLKVMVIQEKRVLFVDSNGKKYMKRL
jgi:uncharacterized iron-regulated membrane protein